MVATVVALGLESGIVCAESDTNAIPIQHHKHHYGSHVQLFSTPNQPLPPPMPADEEVTENKDQVVTTKEVTKGKKASGAPPQMPLRRPELKKKPESPFGGPTSSNETPELKNWGWLANEAEESRRLLQASKTAESNDQAWTNTTASASGTNGTNHVESGALADSSFKPTVRSNAETTTVEHVVEDRAVRSAEKKKVEEDRKVAAKKDQLDMTQQQVLPPLFAATNETMGLTRTHKDEPAANQDFQQTRAFMTEINNRYQLNYDIADVVRRSSATAPATDTPKANGRDPTREKDRQSWRGEDQRRQAGLGEISQGGLTAPPRDAAPPSAPPVLPDSSGAHWRSDGQGAAMMPASGLIEPPKAPKSFEIRAPAGSSTPPASMPATYPPASLYTPTGFKPTTPYGSSGDSHTPLR